MVASIPPQTLSPSGSGKWCPRYNLADPCHAVVTFSVMEALRQERGLVAQLEMDHAARCRRGQCYGLAEEALEEEFVTSGDTFAILPMAQAVLCVMKPDETLGRPGRP